MQEDPYKHNVQWDMIVATLHGEDFSKSQWMMKSATMETDKKSQKFRSEAKRGKDLLNEHLHKLADGKHMKDIQTDRKLCSTESMQTEVRDKRGASSKAVYVAEDMLVDEEKQTGCVVNCEESVASTHFAKKHKIHFEGKRNIKYIDELRKKHADKNKVASLTKIACESENQPKKPSQRVARHATSMAHCCETDSSEISSSPVVTNTEEKILSLVDELSARMQRLNKALDQEKLQRKACKSKIKLIKKRMDNCIKALHSDLHRIDHFIESMNVSSSTTETPEHERASDYQYLSDKTTPSEVNCKPQHTRLQPTLLDTVDFVDQSNGTVVFRTCSKERGKVIMQIGTCDAERALKVAKLVERDVAGIDINMGCPKEFSVKGGMGAALLEKPDNVREIISTLVQGCHCPITAKIRLLPEVEDTVAFCKMLQECGVSAVAIHGRTRQQKPHHVNDNAAIAAVAKELRVPVIANGGSKDIERFEDIEKFRESCGASSVMVARAAQWNASIFTKMGMLPLDDVIKAYLKLAVEFDSAPANAKYCVQSMLRELQETPRGKRFLATQSLQDICDIWDLGEFCRNKQEERRAVMLHNFLGQFVPETIEAERQTKRSKLAVALPDNVVSLPCVFRRSLYQNNCTNLPKTRLLTWTRVNRLLPPTYATTLSSKLFSAVVTVNGRNYKSSYWEKNKRYAEQSAALTCLIALDLESKEKAIKEGTLLNNDLPQYTI